jgi:large subunit ribosomal protein L19
MSWLETVTKKHIKSDLPTFRAGDTVRVYVKITEGEGAKQRTRTQAFEGVCIRRHNAGVSSTFTVRKMSANVGVERIFPLHAPSIDRIEIVREGRVRQSRIFYIRNLRGKAARIKARAFFSVEDMSSSAEA